MTLNILAIFFVSKWKDNGEKIREYNNNYIL